MFDAKKLINVDPETILSNFGEPVLNDILDATFFVACIEDADYESSALFIYHKDNTLFEMSAGHCSCYGYEDLWKPAEINWKYLANKNYYSGLSGEAQEELAKSISEFLNLSTAQQNKIYKSLNKDFKSLVTHIKDNRIIRDIVE